MGADKKKYKMQKQGQKVMVIATGEHIRVEQHGNPIDGIYCQIGGLGKKYFFPGACVLPGEVDIMGTLNKSLGVFIVSDTEQNIYTDGEVQQRDS